MSNFDPQAFLSMTFTDANSTSYQPIPVGEYVAVVEAAEIRPWQTKDGSKSGLALDVKWSIDDAGVKEKMGRDVVAVTQGIMLDLTPQGGLDFGPGRNVNLGRLREAVGLNEKGKPFAFTMLIGKVARITIGHKPATGAAAKPGDVFSDVTGVAKA